MNKKVRWGVLGVASIATRKVIPGMQKGVRCEIAAIASRDLQKRRQRRRIWASQSVWFVRRAFGRPRNRRDLQSFAKSSACAVVHQGRGSRKTCAMRKADRLDAQEAYELLQVRNAAA